MRTELQAALTAATCYGATGGGPLVDVSRTTAWRWVQLAAKRAIDAGQLDRGRHVGTHTLRHSYARHLLLNGIPLNYLSRWLGHASIQTTLIYFVKGGGKLDRADTTTSQRWQTLDQTLLPAQWNLSPTDDAGATDQRGGRFCIQSPDEDTSRHCLRSNAPDTP